MVREDSFEVGSGRQAPGGQLLPVTALTEHPRIRHSGGNIVRWTAISESTYDDG
jgi:hypothetical protein